VNFRIQASYPKNNTAFCIVDEKISEAIETIFPMMTEDAILIWGTSYIPLNYKYDISYMIEDIISMLKILRENQNGELKIDWPTSTFACQWLFAWHNKILTISSKWRSESRMSSNLSDLEINVHEFTYEWKKVLEILIENLESCGYNIDNLKDMKMLCNEFHLIKSYGLLYS